VTINRPERALYCALGLQIHKREQEVRLCDLRQARTLRWGRANGNSECMHWPAKRSTSNQPGYCALRRIVHPIGLCGVLRRQWQCGERRAANRPVVLSGQSVLRGHRGGRSTRTGHMPHSAPGRLLHAHVSNRCGLLRSAWRVRERDQRGLRFIRVDRSHVLFSQLRPFRCLAGARWRHRSECLLSAVGESNVHMPFHRRRECEPQVLWSVVSRVRDSRANRELGILPPTLVG
jgi:hypothetical protein